MKKRFVFILILIIIFQIGDDRFLDYIYYFTIPDESYIMKEDEYSLDKVLKLIKDKEKKNFAIINDKSISFFK